MAGQCVWGKGSVEWDATGKLISETCFIRQPAKPKVADGGGVNQREKKGCGGCKELSLLDKVKGAWKLNQAVEGLNEVDEHSLAERKAICLACEDNDLGRCRVCGCFLWAKIRLAKEACPAGKWLSVA